MGNFTKITDNTEPSKAGKPTNFFSIREQLTYLQKTMPSKNKTSVSFAVSEEKVRRRKFLLNPKNGMLNSDQQ